jgi:hypothetical protein
MPAIEMAGFECVSPVCFPVIEMAGFAPVPYSDPAVEMAGFARCRYAWHSSRAQTLEDWTAAWQLIVVAGGPMSVGIRQQKRCTMLAWSVRTQRQRGSGAG